MAQNGTEWNTFQGGTGPSCQKIADSSRRRLFRRYVLARDHKIVGIQFLFMSLAFFLFAGLLAMLMRWNLAWPNDPNHPVPIIGQMMGWSRGVMPPDAYNMIFTMHASIMVFFVIIPLLVGAFGTYLIPLKIGARGMAFPFLCGLSFWLAVVAGAIMIGGFFLPGGAAASGWSAYPPLSAIQFNAAGRGGWPVISIVLNGVALFLLGAYCFAEGRRFWVKLLGVGISLAFAILGVASLKIVAFDGQSCWLVSLFVLGFSSVLMAVNFLTTIIRLRCPGMTMFRLPLGVWSLFFTALIVLLATPVLNAVLLMNLLDHLRITSFFEPTNWIDNGRVGDNSGGGFAMIFPHLFWFYAHPAVYIMILPAMGFVSDILAVFSRKPVFGYQAMIWSSGAIAFLGFIVWGHHLFQTGMNPALGTTFAVSTMMIAVPSGVKVFNWLGTLWGGNIHLTTPMLNAVAFVSLFVIGGLSGIFLASSAVDAQLHNTYFVVAHIHYVLFGGSTFGIFAAIYFWYPKMFGRMMNETLGKIHFVLSFIFFNCTFFAMHILGMAGMPRRVADYTGYATFRHLQPLNQFITMSAFGLGIAQIPFIINFIGSWFWGERAPDNPWHATTLEWQTASPPIARNFETLPVVYRGAYEYSSPVGREDYLPQNVADGELSTNLQE
jgi:cytochrome c oxidase subunit 1